jgi:putative oxidoreductase
MNSAPDSRSLVWIALEWVAALVLAGVFLAAALPKIAEPAKFALAIYQYGILPNSLVNLVAIYLPWLEISCAAALAVLPAARRGALVLLAGMLVAFTLALSWTFLRGQPVPCGCFGGDGESPSTWMALLRNLGLLALAALGLRATR